MALEWISGGTVAIEFAQKCLNSLYFSLLQGIWQRTVRSGLDPPPPSLNRRETLPYRCRNKRNTPEFLTTPRHTGLEKADCTRREAILSGLFLRTLKR